MELTFLVKGLIIGFLIAAPVGPIGVLCIKRTLNEGKLAGFITGLGAATADALYGFVAAFGLTIISSFLLEEQLLIQIIGIIFLLYLGIKTYLEKPKKDIKEKKKLSIVRDFISTFFLTITNPTTILSFIAVFAGLGLAAAESYTLAGILVIGVFLGSLLWWLLLSTMVGLLRKKMKGSFLSTINKISGVTILVFALVIALQLVRSL